MFDFIAILLLIVLVVGLVLSGFGGYFMFRTKNSVKGYKSWENYPIFIGGILVVAVSALAFLLTLFKPSIL